MHICHEPSSRVPVNHRVAERRPLTLPARLMWTDQRGTPRFASVVTRNVSDQGIYVETTSAVSIPLYRLVQFQLEREAREGELLPSALRQSRVLSAVYRVSRPMAGGRQGLALRLMIDPKRAARDAARATA